MSRYLIAPDARNDLKDIYEYVRQHSPQAAGYLRTTFFEHFRLLASQPLIGEARNDLADGIRMISTGNYVILFRPSQNGVEIVQVVHAARDLEAVFRRAT